VPSFVNRSSAGDSTNWQTDIEGDGASETFSTHSAMRSGEKYSANSASKNAYANRMTSSDATFNCACIFLPYNEVVLADRLEDAVHHDHVGNEIDGVDIFLCKIPVPFIVKFGVGSRSSECRIDFRVVRMMESILIADVVQNIRSHHVHPATRIGD
jgi:hypothetical protein